MDTFSYSLSTLLLGYHQYIGNEQALQLTWENQLENMLLECTIYLKGGQATYPVPCSQLVTWESLPHAQVNK